MGGRCTKFATTCNHFIDFEEREEKYLEPLYSAFLRLIFLLRKIRTTPVLTPAPE